MKREELEVKINEAIAPKFRGRLLAQGQARAKIWEDGIIPDGAPNFSMSSNDLLSYGYALLSMALQLREQNGRADIIQEAFGAAGKALEAVVTNADPNDPNRGFYRLTASACFHLGGFSAQAYSLLNNLIDGINLSIMERGLALLILRTLNDIEDEILTWQLEGKSSDQELLKNMENGEHINATDLFLTEVFFSGLGCFLLALETGEESLVEKAKTVLKKGLKTCADFNLVPQWWCYRLTIHLIDDLWPASFHKIIPKEPSNSGSAQEWQELRDLFIALLNRRDKAEIELWPSQVKAAERAMDIKDDLVVSLPTSAGKTRIAELCILRCLAENKRVIFVTPLRALSAQTEVSLQKTFAPLDKTISTLYGSIGAGKFDIDVLRTQHIVVATPEKLDFALRNSPNLINDVGLIVLDEGHMIGANEREVRYEAQIQRLLKRTDADQRRIVCLSAVLPDGEQLDDFVSWLRRDKEGDSVKESWRPTRQRFGEVVWGQSGAKLDFIDIEDSENIFFIPKFLISKQPSGRRRTLFPKNQSELVLATAWKLVKEGQSVLIFCPEKRSVNKMAKEIVALHAQELLDSVLENECGIQTALTIGEEWLGENHSILQCLKFGVAIHHGSLPAPFRKEVERLLQKGILKVTVSSPTLAQGLNLSATTLIMYSLHRNRKVIPGKEFKNIIGRAGRAFVDTEGLILYPMFDKISKRQREWRALVSEQQNQNLESGLLQLVAGLLIRLKESLPNGASRNKLLEYIMNNRTNWDCPKIEDGQDYEEKTRQWQQDLEILDTAIFSLIGGEEVDDTKIASTLDEILTSSLWERSLLRKEENIQELMSAYLKNRAEHIWNNSTPAQRLGYFRAGVGLSIGQQLDAIAPQANDLLLTANGAILNNDGERATEAIISLAKILFEIPTFKPKKRKKNIDWSSLLHVWLNGKSIAEFDEDQQETLEFIEENFVYKLPWGMEAVRVRAEANDDKLGDFSFDDLLWNFATAAVETGTLNQSAAILIQSGFSSRLTAIKIINETSATFSTRGEFSEWLKSEEIDALSKQQDWPTAEASNLWKSFRTNYASPEESIWSRQIINRGVNWYTDPPNGVEKIKIIHKDDKTYVLSSTYHLLGFLSPALPNKPKGLVLGGVDANQTSIELVYYGPNDIQVEK